MKIKTAMPFIFITYVLIIFNIYPVHVECAGDLHKILGLSMNAELRDIGHSLRALINQWYSTIGSNSTLSEFLHLKIVQAFDNIKENPNLEPLYREWKITDMEDLDDYNITLLHNVSISLASYYEDVFADSSNYIHLVLFYTRSSASRNVLHSWKKVSEILKPYDVVLVTVNMDEEDTDYVDDVTDKFEGLPYLVMIVDAKVMSYNHRVFADYFIIEFIRHHLLTDSIQLLTDATCDAYLSGWEKDNKVRAIIFQPKLPVKFEYLVISFKYRNEALFGIVDMASKETVEFQKRMKVKSHLENLLLIKEDAENPAVKLSMEHIPTNVTNAALAQHKYLVLPRVTSQEIFNDLCPIVSREKLHFCVILVIQNYYNPFYKDATVMMRNFVREFQYNYHDVKFMYMYYHQATFVQSIRDDVKISNSFLIILQRLDGNHIKYNILMNGLTNFQSYSLLRTWLKVSLDASLKNSIIWSSMNSANVGNFIPTMEKSSLLKLVTHSLKEHMFHIAYHILPYIFIFAAMTFFGWKMYNFYNDVKHVRQKLEVIKKYSESGNKMERSYLKVANETELLGEIYVKGGGAYETTHRELRLHELKAETYNGMVRLLKPGCRTIVVMFDKTRANVLITQFYKAVWPYRKNKNLMFGYVNMEKKGSLEWYTELVRSCLPEQQHIEINPKFCAGTVLMLSGMRKYFCIYHIKHRGVFQKKIRNRFRPEEKEEDDFSEDEVMNSNELLLKGLGKWLENIFNGTLIRYHVNHWPDFKIL